MKKVSLLLGALMLVGGVSFAGTAKEKKNKKEKTESCCSKKEKKAGCCAKKDDVAAKKEEVSKRKVTQNYTVERAPVKAQTIR